MLQMPGVVNFIPSLRYGCIAPLDYDRDGDVDMFVTGDYPNGTGYIYKTFLFRNENGSKFVDVSASVLPSSYTNVSDSGCGTADFDGKTCFFVHALVCLHCFCMSLCGASALSLF